MITENDTPPSLLELLSPAPPAQRSIALHVTVSGREGQRAYWMSEGGALFARSLDGRLFRATERQKRGIMRGLDLARRSLAFEVKGQVVEATEVEVIRGLRSR